MPNMVRERMTSWFNQVKHKIAYNGWTVVHLCKNLVCDNCGGKNNKYIV